jgi:hypothetical protein
MPPQSTREGWIKWLSSDAKRIIMEDLICGILPVDANVLSAEEVWNIGYQHMAEFVDVVFLQFKERL